MVGFIGCSALASIGFQKMFVNRLGKGIVFLLLILDLGLLSPISPQLPVTDKTPKILSDLDDLSAGAVLVLPAGGPDISFQQPLWEQRLHRRPILLDPNHPGIPNQFVKGKWMKWLNGLAFHNDNFVGKVNFHPKISILIAKKEYSDRLVEILGHPDRSDQTYFIWDIRNR